MDPATCRATLSTCKRRPATTISVDDAYAVALVLFSLAHLPTSMLSLYAFMGASNELVAACEELARLFNEARCARHDNSHVGWRSQSARHDEVLSAQCG